MEESTVSLRQLTMTSRTLARRLLIIGENRLELLAVEVQEGRERLLHACLLALGIAAFGLLACTTLTAALVLWLRDYSPVCVLLTLTVLYAAAGYWLSRRLNGWLRDRQTLASSLEQLRKDRACLEKLLQ